MLELAVFELCPVSGFEHRAFFARRYFYRTLDERDHEVFFFECGSYVEFGSQYFNFSVRRIYDKIPLVVLGNATQYRNRRRSLSRSRPQPLNAIVAIELTGVVLGAFDVFVDTDFYTGHNSKTASSSNR